MTEHVGDGWTDVGEHSFRIVPIEEVLALQTLHELAELPFALLQRLIRPLALRDVSHRGLQKGLPAELHSGEQHRGGKRFAAQTPVGPLE